MYAGRACHHALEAVQCAEDIIATYKDRMQDCKKGGGGMKTSEFNALRAEMRAMLAEQGYTKEVLKEQFRKQLNNVLREIIHDVVKECIKERLSDIEQRAHYWAINEIKSNINRELRNGVRQAVLEKLEDSDYVKFEIKS